MPVLRDKQKRKILLDKETYIRNEHCKNCEQWQQVLENGGDKNTSNKFQRDVCMTQCPAGKQLLQIGLDLECDDTPVEELIAKIKGKDEADRYMTARYRAVTKRRGISEEEYESRIKNGESPKEASITAKEQKSYLAVA